MLMLSLFNTDILFILDFGVFDILDFSKYCGTSVVKKLPANAGDTGSIPGLGRSHMLQLSPCPTVTEPACPATREATAMRSLSNATKS